MTYDEALAFWYCRVNYERSAPQPADLKLDRMRALLHRLGDPHEQLRAVHVAGSKGKGSTCAMLAAVLRRAGCGTGLFTSPHLEDVRERIQTDGELISRDDLAALMDELRPAVEALEAAGQPPTFFEVGTALGFLHFQRKGCDVVVVEVGLGGRFDSTNVLTPLVSVITSISLDHTAVLGESVEKIAFEKAGIIKPGVPVVSGVTDPAARDVIQRVAAENGAPLTQLGTDFQYRYEPWSNPDQPWWEWGACPNGVQVTTRTRDWPVLPVRLAGEHQAANAAVAVACVECLRDSELVVTKDEAVAGPTGIRWPGPKDASPSRLMIPDEAVVAGLSGVRWPARMEVFRTRPVTVLDCAHNVASAEALVATLGQALPHPRRRLVFAVSSDKDVPGMFRVLAPHFERFYLTRYANSSRSVPPDQMAGWLPPGADRVLCPTPADAWRAACTDATPETLVVVAGSVFLAGELRPLLVEASQSRRP
jgi:dihydrofolate synthase/folylpolyglutamate synthase